MLTYALRTILFNEVNSQDIQHSPHVALMRTAYVHLHPL